MHHADDLGAEPSEFVCTAAPPPCDDPNGSPAWQRSQELCAKVNLPARLERERKATAVRDEAIRRGHHDTAVIAGHHAHEAGQAARRDHRLLYRRAVREHHVQLRQVPALRAARPRGAGRPRASASRSSARSGDSGDSSGSSEGGEPPGLAALSAVAESPAPPSLQPLTERIAAVLVEAGYHPASGLPESFTYRELARIAYATDAASPSRAQLSAVRRSVARLVAAGRAQRDEDTRHRNSEGRHERVVRGYRRTAQDPGGVEVRRMMTPADHEARQAAMRPLLERVEAERQATPYPVDTGSSIQSVPVEPVLLITEHGVRLRESQEGGP